MWNARRAATGFSIAALALGASFFVFIDGGSGPERLSATARPGGAPVAPPASTDATPPADEAATSTVALEPSTAAAPRTGARPEVGAGQISGRVSLPANAPRDLEVSLELREVGEDGERWAGAESLRATVRAGAGGVFEFGGLPTGQYEVVAFAPGFAAHESAELEPGDLSDELFMRLAPAGSVSGRVLNSAGEGVAGAEVFVTGWDLEGFGRAAWEPRALRTRQATDAAGAFRLEHLPAPHAPGKGFRFGVRAEGYAPLESEYIAAGTEGIEWVLKTGGSISGMIVDAATDEALPGRRIRFDSGTPVSTASAQSDAEGFFFVSGLAAGKHAASLDDGELVITPDSAVVEVAEGASSDEVVLRAETGGRIRGRVYDRETGGGIPGVLVSADGGGGPQPYGVREVPGGTVTIAIAMTSTAPGGKRVIGPSREARTDATGAYVIRGLATAPYVISCETPEGYPKNAGDGENRRMVSAEAGVETADVDFVLRQGLQVRGVVVDESGKPISSAQVRGSTYRPRAYDYSESKSDGSFVLAGFAPGQRVSVSGEKRGFAVVKIEPADAEVSLGQTSVDGVRIVLGMGASISGIVVDARGRPRADVVVSAEVVGAAVVDSEESHCEMDGSFELEGLAPGEWGLRVLGSEFSESEEPLQRVRLDKGQEMSGVRLVAPDAGTLTVTGRVEDTRGRPIADAHVALMGDSNYFRGESGPEGAFSIAGVAEGRYELSADHESFSDSSPTPVAGGARDVRIVLKDLATIEGRVVSAATGEPIALFRISAGAGDEAVFGVGTSDGTSFQGADGRFHLAEVEDGATTLIANAEGFTETRMKIARISGGETRREVLVRMEAGATLVGRVLDSAGKPVSGAQIFVGGGMAAYLQEAQGAPATSMADGRFRLASLAAGDLELRVKHPAFAVKAVHTRVALNVDNRIDVVLTSGGFIEGAVTLDGKPVAGQRVSVTSMMQMDSEDSVTDASGRYRIGGLAEGTMQVSASLDLEGGERDQTRQATLREGFATQLDFAFRSGTSAIEGTIFEGEGAPFRERAPIQVVVGNEMDGGDSFSGESDENGRYAIEGLPPGRAQLSVNLADTQKVMTVEIPAHERVRQDIFLFGGATIHVRIRGEGASAMMVPVILMSGIADAQKPSMELFTSGVSQMVGTTMANGGEAVLRGIEAGTYTLMAIAFDPANMSSFEDPLAGSDSVTKVIEVKKDEELTVDLEL